MFNKLATSINSLSGPKSCPSCDKTVTPVYDGAGDEVGDCPTCGHSASSAEWLTYQQVGNVPKWANPDEKPTGSRILKQVTESDVSWMVPPLKGVSFLMIFGIAWCVFSLAFMILTFTADSSGSDIQDSPLKQAAFLGIFWIGGLALLWIGLSQRYCKHVLLYANGSLVYIKSLLGRRRKR